jgi:hypothetical protein
MRGYLLVSMIAIDTHEYEIDTRQFFPMKVRLIICRRCLSVDQVPLFRLAGGAHTPHAVTASGLSASLVQRLSGGASLLHPNAAAALGAPGLAALLLHQIFPIFSVVAPCHPGAALRNPLHN